MKKSAAILISVLLAAALFFTNSCSKDDPGPEFPELMGNWHATTSQNLPLKVDVANIEGTLFVTLVDLKYSFAPGDSSWVHRYLSTGLGQVNGKTFKVYLEETPPLESYVEGTFVSDPLSVSGTFHVVRTDDPLNPLDGTFTGTKTGK